MRTLLLFLIACSLVSAVSAQQAQTQYKTRVLESTEVQLLSSYYAQDGNHAAVSGGEGSEKLTDATAGILVSIPLNDDDVLAIDASISAYTSASSSNIDPFDGKRADPFVASSGASKSDSWKNGTFSYTHSSDDRNQIISGKVSLSSEFDYFSFGFGGSYARQFNEKNTEISAHGNIYLDKWGTEYPFELRPFEPGGNGLNNSLFKRYAITGNTAYNPGFTPFESKTRNSYSFGLGFSQILSKKLQGSLALDFVLQKGLLSTPFQRVYFQDVEASFIESFRLADDIEQLPDQRFKTAVGGRLNYYINEHLVMRGYYRYYTDDWGVRSHTASLEIPVKLGTRLTFYPSYRYYTQTAAEYFAPFAAHLSSETFYTSDDDLSAFRAHQYGMGVTYTDVLTHFHLWRLALKSIDLKFNQYDRNTGFSAWIVSGGLKFILD